MRHRTNVLLATVIAGLGFMGSVQAHSLHSEEARYGSHGHQVVRAAAPRAVSHGDARLLRHVDRRQLRQRHRIKEGWRSGELTRKEMKRLRKGQRRIALLERRFRADGDFSPRERRVLREALDSASDHIYRKKHNDRYRFVRHHDRHGDGLALWNDSMRIGGYDGDSSRDAPPSRRRGRRD